MNDLEIHLDHSPGSLAAVGEALGQAGVSVEGGGAFAVSGRGIAHFLVDDAGRARDALVARGIRVAGIRDVVTLRLDQSRPGQLGAIARYMKDAGVNLEVLYGDHEGRLVLVVDDEAAARAVCDRWAERT